MKIASGAAPGTRRRHWQLVMSNSRADGRALLLLVALVQQLVRQLVSEHGHTLALRETAADPDLAADRAAEHTAYSQPKPSIRSEVKLSPVEVHVERDQLPSSDNQTWSCKPCVRDRAAEFHDCSNPPGRIENVQ